MVVFEPTDLVQARLIVVKCATTTNAAASGKQFAIQLFYNTLVTSTCSFVHVRCLGGLSVDEVVWVKRPVTANYKQSKHKRMRVGIDQ